MKSSARVDWAEKIPTAPSLWRDCWQKLPESITQRFSLDCCITNHDRMSISSLCGAAIGAFLFATASIAPASAEEAVMAPGDAVVTGFSGVKNIDKPAPLDGFFIDTDGPSMQILPIGISESANGQHLDTAAKFSVKASEVGQVFAITFANDPDALPNVPPNIFLGASSAFGLQIVRPDEDGDGYPERLKTGHPQAQWMEGQFGDALGGEPGSIFRVDGTTGDVSLFTTIPGNAGPGLGDVVFDKKSRQFFASDLDTGLIHRIGEDGTVLDAFDHGVAGRTSAGLAPVADDGATLDITSPAFDIENTDSWGLTQEDRRIWGMAVNSGRLYYSVWSGPEIWSVGINEDGTFADDARKEFEVDVQPQAYPISDMVFDGRSKLYLAQRGGLKSSYDYSVFAKAKESNVLRYVRNKDGLWTLPSDSYAIGFPASHKNSSGGIDLGLSLERLSGGYGACDASLWSTGDALRDDDSLDEPRIVHGLQGNESSLVRPQNIPPIQAVFVDYDGKFNDPQAEGHVGDVEIWQPCEGRPTYGDYVPPIIPPVIDGEPEFNLTLEKIADPKECFEQFGGWMCWFTIKVTNTGSVDFAGPITVRDFVPDAPAGAWMDFQVQPPWTCNPPTPALGSDFECTHDPVLLTPGDSVELYADLWLPADFPKKENHCRIRNYAHIVWPGGFGDINPMDDMDAASAKIPSDECDDIPEDKGDLILEKRAQDWPCQLVGGVFKCFYGIEVFNNSVDDFNGDLVINDTVPAGTTIADWAPNPPWNCNVATGDCTWAGAHIPAGGSTHLFILVDVPAPVGKDLNCKVKNVAKIVDPLGGSNVNFDPTNDEDSATAHLPEEHCKDDPIDTNLRIDKRLGLQNCIIPAGKDWCRVWDIVVTNTGPGVFNDVIEIEDNAPAGLSLNLFGVGWNCFGNKCKTNAAAVLNPHPQPGNYVRLKAVLSGTKQQAKEMNCRVNNEAKILSPLGAPKNTNPADDKDNAVAALPEEFCEDPEPRKSNLILRKKADAAQCTQVVDGWKCSWTLTVFNAGPADFHGPVEINETLPGEPVSASWNPSWNCAGVGGGGGAICKHPAVTINKNGFLTLSLDTVFSEAVVKANQCSLTNLAEIAKPTGGTIQNTNPGDDTSQATATVPKYVCEKRPPRCPPGYELVNGKCIITPIHCPVGWTKTPVKGKCCPPGKPWNGLRCGSGTIIDPAPDPDPSCPRPWKLFETFSNIPKGWQSYVVDGTNGQSWYCAKPGRKPEVKCPDGWRQIRFQDRAKLKAKGWKIISRGKNRARIWCGIPPVTPPLKCDAGFRKIPVTSIASYRKKGWTVKRKSRGLKTIWCAKPGTKQCGFNEIRIRGNCVCKPGTSRDRYGRCTPVNPGKVECPKGWKRFASLRQIPKGWKKKTIRKGHKVAFCGRPGLIDPPKKTCEQIGKVGKWPRCFDKPVKRCPKGMVGKWPNCKKLELKPVCPVGTKGKWPNCKKIVTPPKRCPKGTIGKWPNCRKVIVPPKRCPKGTIGKWPNCKKIGPRQSLKKLKKKLVRKKPLTQLKKAAKSQNFR